MGGAIGYEREFNNRPAGLRTHILVCLGAAIISLIQVHSMEETLELIIRQPELINVLKVDMGRLGAQVISGIGFLGAGTIIHERGSIKGLTTAASLWVVGCIGIAIGMGYYLLSVTAMAFSVIVLVILKKFEDKFVYKRKEVKTLISYDNKDIGRKEIESYFKNKRIRITNIQFPHGFERKDGETSERAIYTLVVPNGMDKSEVLRGLSSHENILEVEVF